MRKYTIKVAIVCASVLAAVPGCAWVRGGPAEGGTSALTLPDAAQLESALRDAPQLGSAARDAATPDPAAPAPPAAAAKPAQPLTSVMEAAQPASPPPSDSAADKNKRKAPAAPGERKPPAKPKKERTDKKTVPVQQHRVAQKALSLGQLRHKYSSSFKVAGSPSENKIALTFDDGPDDKYTAQVLDVLKKADVKATFFVIGFRAKAHPELIARMVREGHIVGNHSYNHPNLPKLSEPVFERQIEDTQTVLKSLTGYEPKLFRPPYGAVNEDQVRWAADHQFMIVNWNVDSLDWRGLNAEQVSSNILKAARAGSIVLQHCGGGEGQDLSGTVKALPNIIQQLKSKGYQFVTVPELLHVPKSK